MRREWEWEGSELKMGRQRSRLAPSGRLASAVMPVLLCQRFCSNSRCTMGSCSTPGPRTTPTTHLERSVHCCGGHPVGWQGVEQARQQGPGVRQAVRVLRVVRLQVKGGAGRRGESLNACMHGCACLQSRGHGTLSAANDSCSPPSQLQPSTCSVEQPIGQPVAQVTCMAAA